MLDHVEIYVSDIEKSFQFWSSILQKIGYDVASRWESGFTIANDKDAYLTFVQVEKSIVNAIIIVAALGSIISRFRSRLAAWWTNSRCIAPKTMFRFSMTTDTPMRTAIKIITRCSLKTLTGSRSNSCPPNRWKSDTRSALTQF